MARGQKVFAFENIQHRQRRGAGQRIAGECAAEPARNRGIHDFGASGNRRQRQSPAERFGGHQKIRLDAVVLAGEQPSGAAEAALHFIRDKQHAMLVANFCQKSKKILRRHHEAAFTEHRLGNYRRDIFRRHHSLEGIFQMPGAEQITGGILQP